MPIAVTTRRREKYVSVHLTYSNRVGIRMVDVIKSELTKMNELGELNLAFIDVAVDFFQTYADKCHHL